MAVSIESDDAVINGVNLTVQGSDLTTPASGHAILYAKGGHVYIREDDGTVVDIGPATAGGVATDAIWDASGDLAVGSGANTAAKLSMGTAYQLVQVNSGATTLAYGPALTDWTPTCKQGNQNPTLTIAEAKWFRIGSMVYIYAAVTATTAGQSGQPIIIQGLPITPAVADAAAVGWASIADAGTSIYACIARNHTGGDAGIQFHGPNNADLFGASPAMALANGDTIQFGCWIRV